MKEEKMKECSVSMKELLLLRFLLCFRVAVVDVAVVL